MGRVPPTIVAQCTNRINRWSAALVSMATTICGIAENGPSTMVALTVSPFQNSDTAKLDGPITPIDLGANAASLGAISATVTS